MVKFPHCTDAPRPCLSVLKVPDLYDEGERSLLGKTEVRHAGEWSVKDYIT